MELVIAIAGIVLLWKFSTTLNGFAISARAKTEVMAEKVIGECVVERTNNFEDHLETMKGKKVYSHAEILQHFRVNE